jgi:hypothetical protein
MTAIYTISEATTPPLPEEISQVIAMVTMVTEVALQRFLGKMFCEGSYKETYCRTIVGTSLDCFK